MNKSKKLRIIGWVLNALLAAVLIFASAMDKFTDWKDKAEMFARLAWTEDVILNIGIVARPSPSFS